MPGNARIISEIGEALERAVFIDEIVEQNLEFSLPFGEREKLDIGRDGVFVMICNLGDYRGTR